MDIFYKSIRKRDNLKEKWARFEQVLHKRRYPYGQSVYEMLLITINHHGNAK